MSRKLLLASFLAAAFLATSRRESLASHGEAHWCFPSDRDDCYLEQFHQKVKDVTDLDKYIKQVEVWALNSLVYILSGVDPSGQTASMIEHSPLAFMTRQVGNLAFGPLPMTTGDYLAFKSQDTLFSRSTALAKTGADYLKSGGAFFTIWANVRNIAYSLIIIFIVAVGFMAMIRYQTDPRTTVAAVDLIPKLSVTLLLITFSWVISGLIVDIGIIGVRFSAAAFGSYTDVIGWAFVKSLADIVIGSARDWSGEWWEVVGSALFLVLQNIIVLPILLILIMLIIMLIAMIMLIIELIKRWMMLVMLSVVAPLVFLWGMLPGQEDTTSTWFKNMLVSSLVFPGVATFLSFGSLFALAAADITMPESYPLINEFSMRFLAAVMFLGSFFYATKVSAIIEDLLDVKAGGTSRAGLQAGKMLSNMPLVGKMFK